VVNLKLGGSISTFKREYLDLSRECFIIVNIHNSSYFLSDALAFLYAQYLSANCHYIKCYSSFEVISINIIFEPRKQHLPLVIFMVFVAKHKHLTFKCSQFFYEISYSIFPLMH
jgi:hypothetical protein